jgi:hypothetical protein
LKDFDLIEIKHWAMTLAMLIWKSDQSVEDEAAQLQIYAFACHYMKESGIISSLFPTVWPRPEYARGVEMP